MKKTDGREVLWKGPGFWFVTEKRLIARKENGIIYLHGGWPCIQFAGIYFGCGLKSEK